MTNYFDQFDEADDSPKAGNYFDQFDDRPAQQKPNPGQNTSTLGDLGTAAKRGFQQLPGMATGLVDVVAGGLTNRRFADEVADKAGELTGFQPSKWAEEAREEYSPEYQAAQAEVDQAWDEGDALDVAGAYVRNPRIIAGLVAESAPQMLAGGAIGRGALVAGRAAGAIGAPATVAQAARQAATAGAAGEGAVVAGSTMNQIDEEVEPQRAAAAALGAGAGTAVLGRIGAAAAQRLGLTDVESAIAGGVQRTADEVPGLGRRLAGGAVAEGLIEELPQSVQEQMWQNFAENKALMEGTGRAAVEGTLAGGVMGAGVNVLPARKPSEQMGIDPNAGPLSAAAATAVDGAPTGSQSPLRDATQSSLRDGAPVASSGAGIRERDLADLPTAVAQDMFFTEVDDQNSLRYFQYDQNLQAMVEVPANEALAAAQARIQEAEQLGEDPLSQRSPGELLPEVSTESGAAQVEEVEALPAFEQGETVVWANKDFDYPVEFLGFEAAPGSDGRLYARVRMAGHEGYVPAAELQAQPEQAPPLPTVDMDTGPQAVEQVQAEPVVDEQGYEFRVQKNGRPFKGERDVRLLKALNEAKAAGEQAVVVQHQGGWAVAVPRAATAPAAPLALPAPNTMVVDAQGNAQRGPVEPFVEPAARVRPLGGPGMERQAPPTSRVDQQANEAATSPANQLPEPTQAQKEAGNYRKGHVRVAGLDISIENPRGSERSGQRPDGSEWRNTMSDHYGYIRRTEGADGEQVDVYLGPREDSGQVFVVDQLNQGDGSFDEHKVMIGFPSQEVAVAAYRNNFDAGWKVGPVTAMSMDQFKTWLKGGDLRKPLVAPEPEQRAAAKGPRRRVDRDRDSLLQAVIRLGGIKTEWRQDTTGESKGNRHIPGVGALWSDKTGTSIDDMASQLDQYGYLPAGEMDNLGGVPWLQQAIRDELAGTRYFAAESAAQQEQLERELQQRYADEQARLEDQREAEYARIEAEYGAEVAAQARAYDEAAKAYDEQVLAEAQQFEDDYEQRQQELGEIDGALGGQPLDQARAAARDEQLRDATDGQDREQRAPARPSQGQGGEPAGFSLEQQTEEGLREQAAQQQAAQKAEAEAQRQAEQKEQADRGRADFTLSGSDRPADVAEARGQNDMFAPRTRGDVKKIEDFGEKLLGARKFQTFTQRMDEAKALDVKAVPLSKSWPEPDYQALLADGADPWSVGFLRAAREEIPNKPSKGWKVERWAEQVTKLRDMATKVAADPDYAAKVKARAGDAAALDKGFLGRVELYERFGHDVPLKGMKLHSSHYSMYRGEKDVTKWLVDGPNERNRLSNWPVEYAVADTKDAVLEAFAKVHAKLKAKGEEADVGPKIRFDIFSDRFTKAVFIGKKNGKRVVKMKTFPDVQAAREYLKSNQADLEAQYERMKQLPAVRGEDNAPRVGSDYRNGLDVTPELFSETFGFRGVQFGNYVEGRRRQQDLNDAFDALMDMAGVLNIPPRAISLNGELGLAFGARGTGGPDPAMAHYEPDLVVINLTKAKGAGSLGHEWWHSLDNYLSRARGAPAGMLSEAAYERGAGVRPEIVEAFANINKAINRTQLRQRSEKMDELRTKDYWSTKLEMTARAFESYLIAKLSEGGVRSDYLANVVSEQAFALEDSYPYPTAAEIPDIRAAYDNLFQVIETRQDDNGNVALYRLNPEEPMLRLNAGNAGGISPFSAKAIARQVQEATGLRATVVDTEFALPAQVLEQVLRDGAVGRVAGVYHNGQAYLVTSNLQSPKHAQEVLLHEVVGHQGVRAVLGNRTGRVMEQIYDDIPAAERRELEERYSGQLANLTEQELRITVAEEYVAHLAETNPQHSLIQRLVALVRAALRRVFGATGALRWTDDDIVALLADSRRMVTGGAQSAAPAPKPAAAVNYRQKPVAPQPAALPVVEEVDAADALDELAGQESSRAFARSLYRARGTDSPFFQRWFKGSRMADRSGRPIAFYHRSFGEKARFDDTRLGGTTGTGTAALGHFLARQDVGNVERYGPVVERFFVRMRKPKVVSQQQFEAMGDWTDAQVKDYRKTMMEQGHDGLYIMGLDWPVVFEGKNIKAVRNSGTFDESDQVRYSLAQDAGDLFNRFGRRPAELNDPFAEENRRLREQDKTLWSRAKQQFRRQFAPGGLLPEAVFAEKIHRDSEFQAVEFDVRHLAGGLEQAVKADFGAPIDQLQEAQLKPLAEALAGRVDAALPQRTREAVVAMRQYIDSLSGEYIGILQQQVEQNLKDADPGLVETITRNMGSYVHRSYRAFDDAKWFEKVPTETLNAARRYLANQYQGQGADAQEALRMADVKVNELLKTGTAYSSMESMIAEGKLGAKDLSVLIKRKEIAPEIRALLGEYVDPRVNFAKSATKMGRLIWNQRFLDRVRAQGMGTFLFEEGDRPAGATEQLAGEQSDTYAPMNGLWTFPEVAQAFRDSMGKEQMSDLYRTVVRLNGLVKYGKTVLSPTTAMRNWQSAMFFSLANGHFDLSQMKKSLAAFREQVSQSATGEDLAYLRKLKQLGVVYDTPYAGEMARFIEDAKLEELLEGKTGTGLKWLRQINQVAQGFYSFGDDFWKIIGFENEKAGLQKAGFSEAEAERMAAERIRNTYPTYSMVGRGIDWLRRFPLAGTFVSFPSEIVRTTVNMLRQTASDLKSSNPGLQALGRRRAVGMAMVSAGFYALSAMTAAALGVDDDEEEALRDLAPEWQKNSTFLFAGRDADGKLRYFDMSFLDPYGYWKRPLTAMLRDQPWEKAAASGLSDLLSPFLGADITAGAIFEVMANKKGSGGQVYQENGDPVDQALDIADHLRKALQPGFVSNAERLALAGQGVRREGSGQAYDLRDEVVSLLGWRASTTDARTALHYRAYEFGDALAEARRVLTRELRSQNKVDEEDIRDARDTADQQYQQAFREMGRLVQAAQTAGMGRAQVMQTLRMSGVSSADVAQLMRGEPPRFALGPASMTRAIQQARLVGGQEHAAEVARRYRLAMQL